MNVMAQLLQDDLNRLSDRLAAGVSSEAVARVGSQDPELYRQLEAVSARLADLRAALVEQYAAWALALEECEALWATAEASAERVPLDRAA
jgi:hypothetical protein